MEWIEKELIPEECQGCEEMECYNCDIAGKRWELLEDDILRIRRKLLIREIARLERKVEQIDIQLQEISK